MSLIYSQANRVVDAVGFDIHGQVKDLQRESSMARCNCLPAGKASAPVRIRSNTKGVVEMLGSRCRAFCLSVFSSCTHAA